MTCSETRERMLVADLAELQSESSALGAHVAGCASCKAAASALVSTTVALGSRVGRRRVSSRRNRIAMLAALPVAAAIVGILFQKRVSSNRDAGDPMVRSSVTHGIGVDIAPGQQATVIKTADPKVTVIWLTPGVGE